MTKEINVCDHICSGNCRREGCNCECGEFHNEENPEIIDDKCAYCGENKWQNREKHIAELAKFLQEKIREIQEILKKA